MSKRFLYSALLASTCLVNGNNNLATASAPVDNSEITDITLSNGVKYSVDAKQRNVNICLVNQKACDQGYITQTGNVFTPEFLEVQHLQANTQKFDSSALPEPILNQYNTVFKVCNQDSFVAAQEMIEQGLFPCVANAANAQTPGGGFTHGSKAQEEELCRRSTLYKGLLPILYPIQGDQLIYNPQVTVFMSPTTYNFLDQPFKVDVITQAYINLGAELTGIVDPEKHKDYQNVTKSKIRGFFRLAALKGHDSVVLAAVGCGAFSGGRPGPVSEAVARLFHEVIDPEFNGVFREIRFAILGKPDFNPIIFENFQRQFGFRHNIALGNYPFIKLTQGFSESEKTHQWTNAQSAMIELDLNTQPRTRSISFEDTSAFLPSNHTQTVLVKLNNRLLNQYQYTNGKPSHTINVTIPLLIQGTAKIEFVIPNATAPKDHPELMNGDSRQLGILFKDAVLT